MAHFYSRLSNNQLDTEINEFGDLDSLDFKSRDIEIKYRKGKSWREIERARYKTTGIAQLGTTYPTPYDRESLIKKEYLPNSWYGYPFATFAITLIAVIIDTFCYLSMFGYGRSYSRMENFYILISTLGAAIAIDILPMFLAHNLHRISNCSDNQKVKKWVLITFSIISFLLFVFVVGIVFKLRLYNVDKLSNEFWKFVLMSMIPISTSLLCFISGYLSFSLYRKKLINLKSIKLFLEENICEMNAMIEEFNSQPNYYETLKQEEEALYNAANNFVDDVSDYYKTYARMYIIPYLQSPAATSDLTVKELIKQHEKTKFPIQCDEFFEKIDNHNDKQSEKEKMSQFPHKQ